MVRYTSSEASTGDGLGVAAWSRLHANYRRRTLGRIFRVQRECTYGKPTTDVSQVRLAILQSEKTWKATMSEIGGDAKVPDLWRSRLCWIYVRKT